MFSRVDQLLISRVILFPSLMSQILDGYMNTPYYQLSLRVYTLSTFPKLPVTSKTSYAVGRLVVLIGLFPTKTSPPKNGTVLTTSPVDAIVPSCP